MLTCRIFKNSIPPNKLDSDLYAEAIYDVAQTFSDDVARDARRLAPRAFGNLADSVKSYVGAGDPPRVAGVKVGSRHAAYVHGAFALPAPPRRRTRPHMPPDNQSIRRWARLRGIPVYVLRLAIAKRGTPIIPFVAEATEKNWANFNKLLARAATRIESKWGK